MKCLTIKILILTMINSSIFAQNENQTIRLFEGKAPNQKIELIEKIDTTGGHMGGRSVSRATDIDTPTITIYKAKAEKPADKTVIVAPGGGYQILSMDSEGSEVCEFLNSRGIDAVLLKHRVPRREGAEKHIAALEDMQRAISVVKSRAKEFGICDNNIGVMGFSAGAHLAVMASTTYNNRVYPRIDSYDDVNLRPDFAILIYPAYLHEGNTISLASDIKPTIDTPPTFIAQTQDDKVYINSAFAYGFALKELGVPITMHIYSVGGHGFGLRNQQKPSDRIKYDLVTWLEQLP